jgi:peptide deformylase
MPDVKDDDIKYCLRYLDDDLLREKCERVESLGTTERELIKAMADVMVSHRGVGLAAPQVGALKRIIVVHPSILPEGADTLFINPEIVWTSDDEEVEEEGCLSLLSIASPLARPARVAVKYINARGERESSRRRGSAPGRWSTRWTTLTAYSTSTTCPALKENKCATVSASSTASSAWTTVKTGRRRTKV